MRKFGTNKKNPNPPWPDEQSVVVMPPGSNSASMGMPDVNIYEMPGSAMNGSGESNTENGLRNERELRQLPIMGNMTQPQWQMNRNRMPSGNNRSICGNMSVTSYLCGQIGKYVKLEFLFGENMHMEKIGRLRGVGKDFVAISENGTNNTIVCATNKIKFINIYEFGK